MTGVLMSIHSCSDLKNDNEGLKPNVLLILTDDQGWGDFGFNGNSTIQTPVLDAMASRSAHLTNFYTSPLSATTRAGLLTGRDHLRTGSLFVTRASENMDSGEQTLAEILKDNGYATGCFGKWYNGAHYPQDPNGQGFDEFVGFCSGHHTNYFDTELQFDQEMRPTRGYITDVLTDHAIDYIDRRVESRQADGKPFFCYVAYNAPHAPYQVPDAYYEKYTRLQKDSLDMTPAVYAMCECVDTNIGRLLQTLEKDGVLENTLVVFLSDNGPNNVRYNGNMSGLKGDIYEGGMKVPCLIYWQGRITPVKIGRTISYIDVMPTILDLCGIDPSTAEHELDGLSVKDLLWGDRNDRKALEMRLKDRYLFSHRSFSDTELHKSNGVVYNDRYKLLVFDKQRLLMDKAEDPQEKNDLSSTHKELYRQMSDAYDKWFGCVGQDYRANIHRETCIGLLPDPSILQAPEAWKEGRVEYRRNIHGWAGDWLCRISAGDSIGWKVNVKTAGTYSVKIRYALRQEIRNFTLGVSSTASRTSTSDRAVPVFESEMIPSPDRVPRVEAYEQTWATLDLGSLDLKAGEDMLLLTMKSDIQELKGFEVKAMIIKKTE